jgi:hypothetical protein
MNLHLPQNELARAELSGFVMNDCQYIGPRDGGPLRGLIQVAMDSFFFFFCEVRCCIWTLFSALTHQDHVLSGVYLTCKDSFFTKYLLHWTVYIFF